MKKRPILLIALGLVLNSAAFVIFRNPNSSDFLRGIVQGIGIGMMIFGIVLLVKEKRSAR